MNIFEKSLRIRKATQEIWDICSEKVSSENIAGSDEELTKYLSKQVFDEALEDILKERQLNKE